MNHSETVFAQSPVTSYSAVVLLFYRTTPGYWLGFRERWRTMMAIRSGMIPAFKSWYRAPFVPLWMAAAQTVYLPFKLFAYLVGICSEVRLLYWWGPSPDPTSR